MQHPNQIKTIWLPAEISQNPLHHSRRGARQGGAFGPQAPIPGGYGATDPEKSLQHFIQFDAASNLDILGPFAEWSGAKLDKTMRDGPFYPARKQG